MTIEDQIKDEKVQYDINERPQKIQLYHRVKLISTNILPVKRYCHLINNK